MQLLQHPPVDVDTQDDLYKSRPSRRDSRRMKMLRNHPTSKKAKARKAS